MTNPTVPDALLTNGQIGDEHFTPTADAARRIASYCEGDARKNVYKAALQELTAFRAGQSHADAALLAALEEARDVFQHYGDLHAAKPDPVKAQRNYDLAAKMSAAIAAAIRAIGAP